MLIKEMFSFRENMDSQGIILCYNGYMTEDVLFSIGSTIKNKLILEKTNKKIVRGLFSLFVEQMQNVIHYSEEKESGDFGQGVVTLRHGMLIVGLEKERYFVSCGNMVDKNDVETLRAKLDHIQSLDEKGLKDLFRETLKGETPEGSLGAGVGFIDIARRATKGFEFDFTAVDDIHSYFSIKAYV